MAGSRAGDRAIVLDANQEKTALAVGQADDRLDQVGVGQRRAALTLELDGEALAGRHKRAELVDGGPHGRGF
jgi:hypothetical protein